MRKPIIISTFAVALILGAIALSQAPMSATPVAQPVARAPRIGYVDLTRVLRDYERRGEFEADLKSSQAAIAVREKELVAQSSRLSAEIDQLAMGTSERSRLEKQYTEILTKLQGFRKENLEILNKKFVATITVLFDDVIREVDAFGQENDYDLIIKDQSSEAAPTTHDAVVLQVTKRVVLYSKPEYDLSEEIVRRLNEKYRMNLARSQDQTQPEISAEER